MFNPTYRITPFLISCLEKISSQKVIIKRMWGETPIKPRMSKDSFNRSVHSSTWIEGNILSLAQVAALSENRDVEAQEKQKIEVKNCIKALRWVLRNKNLILTEQRLLTLHAMMTDRLLPASRCGQYRDVQNFIVNAKNQIIFTPIPPNQVKQKMKDLFLWLKKNQTEHPIIRGAIFHHNFVNIHPFVDGNGRVARAGSQWILFYDGYDPVWTFGLDEFFANDRAKYYDIIQQTHEMDGDYTHWIEYIAQGLVEAIETVIRRVSMEKTKQKNITLTPRQSELLELLKKHRTLGSAEICKEMRINRARVNQLIAPLVKSNIVIKQGITRAVKYHLA